MPGAAPTTSELHAYRFSVRRLVSAVSVGDSLLPGDHQRRRRSVSLTTSVVVAAVLSAAFAVYGHVHPARNIGNAAVVIASESGGVFVSRAGRLYPAMNLSSALLAAGRGQHDESEPSITSVGTDTIGKYPRGPLIGIPGAPDTLPKPDGLLDPLWTVCDRSSLRAGHQPRVTTTAIIGAGQPGSLSTGDALLVSADNGTTTFLVWGNQRAKIDLRNATIRLALGIAPDASVRPISAALLGVIPVRPDLVVPNIDTSGTRPAYTVALGVRTGEVFRLDRADRSQSIYVALPDGLQAVTALVADLIRDQFDGATEIPAVSPRLLSAAPRTAHPIDLSQYPATRPLVLDADRLPVTCVARSGTATAGTRVVVLGALPLARQAKPVTAARYNAVTVDDVYVRPGRGALVSTTTAGRTVRYLITDDGVAYPVSTTQALIDLGFAAMEVRPVSPELVDLLPRGPVLDPSAAARFYSQTAGAAGSLPPAGAGSPG